MISCALLSTPAKPAPPEDVAHVLVVPEVKGPTGLLPGAGTGGGGISPRSAVARCHGFCSTPCQQAKTRRPPAPSMPRMARNATRGSSKNITPNWLTARSKGA